MSEAWDEHNHHMHVARQPTKQLTKSVDKHLTKMSVGVRHSVDMYEALCTLSRAIIAPSPKGGGVKTSRERSERKRSRQKNLSGFETRDFSNRFWGVENQNAPPMGGQPHWGRSRNISPIAL